MIPTLVPIGALLCGIALLLLGSGLVNTVIPLRGSLEGFSTTTLGLIGSTYFLGFFLGTFVAPRLIRRMGQEKGGHIANRSDQRHQDEAGPPATGAPEGDPRRDEDQRKTTHP